MTTTPLNNEAALKIGVNHPRYVDLAECSDTDLRDFLVREGSYEGPAVLAALVVYELDRIKGYRELIDELTAKPAEGVADTSKQAAAKINRKVSGVRAAVLKAIAVIEPANADRVAEYLELDTNSVYPRFGELRRAGYIERTGNQGPTRWGNPAELHQLTDDGHRKLTELNAGVHS